MSVFTSQFPELMETRQKLIVFLNYINRRRYYTELMAVNKSTKSHEDRMRVAALGTFQDKPEGLPVAFSDPVEGTRRRVIHSAFGLGYRRTHEAEADDQWAILNKMPSDMGNSAADHEERIAWDLINDGFTGTNNTGLDGLSLFNTAHTSLRPEVAVQSNSISPAVALGITGLETILTMRRTTRSEEGRFIELDQSILLVPPDLEHTAYVLLNTQQRVGTADNDISTVSTSRTGWRVLVVPYLTSTTAWSVHDVPGKNSLTWNNRESLMVKEAMDSESLDKKTIGYYRASVMFSEWRGNWGSAFA